MREPPFSLFILLIKSHNNTTEINTFLIQHLYLSFHLFILVAKAKPSNLGTSNQMHISLSDLYILSDSYAFYSDMFNKTQRGNDIF